MIDDPEALEDERAVELSSIAAIFPELVIDSVDFSRASIDIPVSPAQPLTVLFPPLAGGAPPDDLPTPPHSDRVSGSGLVEGDERTQAAPKLDVAKDIQHLSHLPPLSLDIQLPVGYPAESPPVFHLSTSPPWLPTTVLEQLKDRGDKLWEDVGRSQVVFDYIDHLQQAAEQGFGLTDITKIAQEFKIPLLDFDSTTKRQKFEQETFDCGICLGKPCPVGLTSGSKTITYSD